MATNGTLTKQIRSDISIYISWNASQNQNGNYSDIKASLYINRKYPMYSQGSGSITLNGTSKNGTYNIQTSTGGLYKVAAITKRVNHNQDGTASFTLGGSVDFKSTNLSGTILNVVTIAKQTIQLNQIKRLAIVNLSNFILDTQNNITITKYLAGSVDLKVYANNNYIKTYRGVGTSQDLSFTASQLDTIYKSSPNSERVQVKVTAISKDTSGNRLGSTSKTVTGTIPTSIKPSLGTITVTDTNPKNTNPATLLQYVSTLKLLVSNVTAETYASIKSISWSLKNENNVEFYKTSGNGVVTPPFTSQHGNIKITATVTDSRNRTKSSSVTKYLSHYRSPSLSKMVFLRANSEGIEDPSGTSGLVKAEVKGASVSGENPIILKLFKKTTTTTSYPTTPYYQLTLNSLSWNTVYNLSNITDGIDIADSWDIKIELSDRYSTTSVIGQLATASIPLAFSESSVGIGGFPIQNENAKLQIFGEAAFSDKLKPLGGANTIKGVLVNGWTGEVYYQKDGFGNVHLWGKIAGGPFKRWAKICVLGQEYANSISNTPIVSLNENISKGSRICTNLHVTNTGNLTIQNTTNAYIDDTFSFNISYHVDGGW